MEQSDSDFDLEELCIREMLCVTPSTEPKSNSRNKPKGKKNYEPVTEFIPRIPGPWIGEAAKIPGHAIHVAFAVLYFHKEHVGEVILTDSYFEELFNIARKPAGRGLDALQQAGLIKYTKTGDLYRVTILPIEPETWYIFRALDLWTVEAAKLPGTALHVALAIRYVHGMEKMEEVTLRRRYHFNPLNISRGQVQRGMEELQQAGLIRYIKDANSYVVTILPVKPEDSTENDQNASRASC